EYWHQALGHLAPSSFNKVKDQYSDAAIIPPAPKDFHCSNCIIAKSTHHKPKATPRKERTKFDLIHTDLSGPFPAPSYGGKLYYITLVDDATRCTWVRFLKHKSESTQVIKDFVAEAQTQHGITIKAFRHDNGGEYVNNALEAWYKTKGIVQEPTPPYHPESNGVAERLNRTIGEGIRAMLLNLGKYYDKKLWAEAVQTFVYLKNRQPHSALKDQTPYEAFHGTKPSIHHLQPFGRECYPHIPEATRKSGKKLAPRARLGLFVGYTKVDHHYRVFLPDEKRTTVSADVFFPPFNSEGATTKDVPSKTSTTPTPKAKLTDLSKTPNLDTDVIDVNIDYDGLWIDWMKRHPAEANMLFQRGDPTVQRLMQQEYERGYRDTFLSREFWGDALDDNDTPSPDTSTNSNQHQQQPPSPPPQLPSRSPSPTPMEG